LVVRVSSGIRKENIKEPPETKNQSKKLRYADTGHRKERKILYYKA
jgi:hypothetical protein